MIEEKVYLACCNIFYVHAPIKQYNNYIEQRERNGKFSQNGKFGQNGKLGHSCTNVTKAKPYDSQVSYHAIVHLGLNVSSSAHNCGCLVDGSKAMAAILVL